MPTCRPTTTCGVLLAAACVLLTGCQMPTTDAETTTFAAKAARERAAEELLAQHGSAHEERIRRGVDQLARMWRESDGNTEAFVQFARDEFLPAGDLLDETFNRFEYVSESLDGYFNAMIRDLRRGVDLEIGPLLPLDRRLAAFNSAAHLFAQRDAVFAFSQDGIWTDPAETDASIEWVRGYWQAMRAFSPKGAYVNFMEDEGEDRIREAYGDNYDRLVAIKNKYDPTNLFRLNQNIKPNGG